MASTHVNHNIYITEVKTGKCLHSLVGHRRTPWCVTFHPTIPGLLASGCLDGEVRIWDLHVSAAAFTSPEPRCSCRTGVERSPALNPGVPVEQRWSVHQPSTQVFL